MKVRTLKHFNDGWGKCTRKPGEVFETTPERVKYFNSTFLGRVVEKAPKKEEVKTPEGEGKEPNTPQE